MGLPAANRSTGTAQRPITLFEKFRLLWGLLSGERAYTGPFFVDVDTTRRCNLRCVGCPYHALTADAARPSAAHGADVSPVLIEALCKELAAMGTREIVFTGEGEPFLHPRLFEALATARAHGLRVQLLTNGTLLGEEQARSLIDLGVESLRVSLWAAGAEDYPLQYSGADSRNFERVVCGIKVLATLKRKRRSAVPRISVHQPINRYNFDNIQDLICLTYRVGCDAVSFSPLRPWSGRFTQHALTPAQENRLRPTLLQAKATLDSLHMGHNIVETLRRYRIGEAVWEAVPCYSGWTHTRIKSDGTVLPCGPCELPLGNLRESSFREIWNGRAYRSFRSRAFTKEGLASMRETCDCGFCCLVESNLRIHRVFRWLAPLALRSGGASHHGELG